MEHQGQIGQYFEFLYKYYCKWELISYTKTMNEQAIYISEKVKDSSGIVINPATIESGQETAQILAMLMDSLQFWLQTDKSKTLKVQLDPLLTHTTIVSTIATLTTLTNLANIQRQGDIQMQRITEAQMDSAYIPWVYNNLIFV